MQYQGSHGGKELSLQSADGVLGPISLYYSTDITLRSWLSHRASGMIFFFLITSLRLQIKLCPEQIPFRGVPF